MSERPHVPYYIYQALSRTALDAAPCPCTTQAKPDPFLDEHLTVWDDEKTGARYWDEKTRTLHIVQTEPTDTVRIEYTGPNQPGSLDVRVNGRYLETLPGGGSWSHEITYIPSEDPYEGWEKALIPLKKINTYAADVCSYEYRCSEFTVTINVYNPDQWELKLKVPPLGKQSMGRRLSRNLRTGEHVDQRFKQTQITDAVTGSQTSTSQSSETITGENYASERQSSTASKTDATTGTMVSVSHSQSASTTALKNVIFVNAQQGYAVSVQNDKRPPSSKVLDYVQLSRNSQRLGVDVLDFIGIAISFVAKFHALKSAIRNAVPEIGWFWDVELSILEGDLAFSWGWHEDTDHSVYYQFGFGAEIMLISAQGSIGIGFKAVGVTAQAIAKLKGKIPISAGPLTLRIEEDGPSAKQEKLGSKVAGILEMTAEIVVEAGDVISAKAQLSSEFLKARAQTFWSPHENCYCKSDLSFGGLSIRMIVRVSKKYDRQVDQDLIDAQPLGEFRFPKPDDPEPEDIDTSQKLRHVVKDKFKTSLFDGSELKFYVGYKTTEKEWFVFGDTIEVFKEEELGNDYFIDHITSMIWAHRRKLDMNHTTIEGLLYSVKEDLRSEYGEKIFVEQFWTYKSSDKFTRRIKEAESPAKRLKKELGETDSAGS
ncbi:hypothetical protein [Roseovarius sp.]|uniref:hypothetical protein n=1 Tax=Roseovarius sp. TaxID=1486281 RepID=UPI0035682DB9